MSIVVCAFNAAATIAECLSSLQRVRYPRVETIVVNDGSSDATGAIARAFHGVTLIETANGGLSAARNVGLANASGDIIAYVDADVRVDPDWLTHLVRPLVDGDFVASGGPNVGPPDDPWLAQCVARAPGSPTHILFADGTAEHVPGCNMAIRRDALVAIGGFDRAFVRAGDDVDVCWRLQARGGRIAFAPDAVVWHRHRASFGAFWKQQVGYGEGEAWLMPRHPQKFASWRIVWHGRIYSDLPMMRALAGGARAWMLHTATWQMTGALLLGSGAVVSAVVHRLSGAIVAGGGGMALAATAASCVAHAVMTDVESIAPPGRAGVVWRRPAARLAIAALHFMQPLARRTGWVRGLVHGA